MYMIPENDDFVKHNLDDNDQMCHKSSRRRPLMFINVRLIFGVGSYDTVRDGDSTEKRHLDHVGDVNELIGDHFVGVTGMVNRAHPAECV